MRKVRWNAPFRLLLSRSRLLAYSTGAHLHAVGRTMMFFLKNRLHFFTAGADSLAPYGHADHATSPVKSLTPRGARERIMRGGCVLTESEGEKQSRRRAARRKPAVGALPRRAYAAPLALLFLVSLPEGEPPSVRACHQTRQSDSREKTFGSSRSQNAEEHSPTGRMGGLNRGQGYRPTRPSRMAGSPGRSGG